MTSNGLKRSFEYDRDLTEAAPPLTTTIVRSPDAGLQTNGSNKRRCTPQLMLNSSPSTSSSPFKHHRTYSTSNDLAAKIKQEIDNCIKASNNHSDSNNQAISNDPPVLTAKQAQTICENLIREREQELRSEYDKMLASKHLDQSHHHQHQQLLHPHNQPGAALAASILAYNLQQQAVALQHVHQQTVQQVTGGLSCPTPSNDAILSGPVLLASSLDEQLATPEALFTLFGVFGDVIRVKILFNKKDNALVQMADPNQAQVAQGYLDKQRIYGKNIRVTRSKHLLVQMPRDGSQSDAGLTKDFTNSPLHRFKIPGSRNYLNIYPPSSTLHVSNIPTTIDEKKIQAAFKDACGFDYCWFKFFPKDRKMALMKFNSTEHATIALIKMHNFQISEENNLRVSFSKSLSQQ